MRTITLLAISLITLGIAGFVPIPTMAAVDRTDDAFLAGYIASVPERDLHWQSGSYHLQIVKGIATITLFQEDATRRQNLTRIYTLSLT